jgi:hypothetical protein
MPCDPSQARPAPVPCDTQAKGWRFELDMEQVRQSDTWALASPAARPWLLMLWAVAWEQKPCGSLPDDDELIAARIGMDLDTFAGMKRVLLRGWWLADDGRLYHDTIVERVQAMLAKKEKDRQRKAGWRARQASPSHAEDEPVTPESRGTDTSVTPESERSDDTKHQAPSTSTSLRSEEGTARKRAPKFDPTSVVLPPWLSSDAWGRWCKDRAERKKPVTEEGAKGQIRKLEAYMAEGFTPEEVIEHSIASGYQGLYAPARNRSQSRADEHARVVRELTGGLMSPKPQEGRHATGEIIDV